jgi:glycosyltransferase involved in cell wall biosynthesis
VTRSPTVLVDATPIPADRGGVGRYVDGIIPALVASGVDVTVVCQPRDAEHFAGTGARVIASPAAGGGRARRLLWEQLRLPRIAKRLAIDVVHSVHYTFPLFTRRRRVVTLHDLTFFTHPEVHTRGKVMFFRAWIRLCRRAHVTVVTPSEATAREYCRITGADPETVTVAHLGFDSVLFHPPSADELAEFVSGLEQPVAAWIAFLGTLEPRKNVAALVDGYCRALADAAAGAPPALLLAGGRGWDTEVDSAIDRARAAGFDVRRLGYLPLDQLSAFLGGADIVAYPSFGEGFGLPVLEAMATGACVLTTRELSLPEVGGDAVEYTTTDAASIGSAIGHLLGDREARRSFGEQSRARAATFTWDACARAHIEAYRKAETS